MCCFFLWQPRVGRVPTKGPSTGGTNANPLLSRHGCWLHFGCLQWWSGEVATDEKLDAFTPTSPSPRERRRFAADLCIHTVRWSETRACVALSPLGREPTSQKPSRFQPRSPWRQASSPAVEGGILPPGKGRRIDERIEPFSIV